MNRHPVDALADVRAQIKALTSWTILKVPDEFPLWKLNKPYELPIYVYEQEIADSVQELIRLGQATGTRNQMIEKLRPAIEASCNPLKRKSHMTSPSPEILIARLAREGWTPPVAVDPDMAEAKEMADDWMKNGLAFWHLALAGIKRGRALAAEAKPGVVWSKFDFVAAKRQPVGSHEIVCAEYSSGSFSADFGANIYWPNVTHYAIITPPAEDVA